MSPAVVFLLTALGASAAGSTVLWLVSGRRRAKEPDYHERLRAIAPSAGADPIEQPSGIGSLDELNDEER